jgi:hypothetical protein
MKDAEVNRTLCERKQESVYYTDYHIDCAIDWLLAQLHVVARVGENDRILSKARRAKSVASLT